MGSSTKSRARRRSSSPVKATKKANYQSSGGLGLWSFFKGFLVVAVSFSVLQKLPWFATPIGWIIVPFVIQSLLNQESKSASDTATGSTDEGEVFTTLLSDAHNHVSSVFASNKAVAQKQAAEEILLTGKYGPKARHNRHLNYQEKSATLLPGWVKDMKPGLAKWVAMIDWVHMVVLFVIPLWGLYGAWQLPAWHTKTVAWAVLYYFFTGFGITAGYHRLFSHCAYKAHAVWKFIILMAGTGAVQGSAKWWSINHRAHHRYTDTDMDPYNAQRGLLYSHLGWMIYKLDWNRIGRVEAQDLKASKLLAWQHKHYLPLALVMALGVPAVVAHYGWGDFWGGLHLAGICRLIFVQHSTFCVNSLAHYLGEDTYDNVLSPRDHIVTALVTLGEGNHNFHHEYPNDYRNAIRWWQYDPTKWLIKALSWVGMTTDLKKFDENTIQRAKLNMKQLKLDAKKKSLDWGLPISGLPVWTREQFVTAAKEDGVCLILLAGLVHDVSKFVDQHPGGARLMHLYNGKDATAQFDGASYNHTTSARSLASTLRVARIHEDDLPKSK